MSRLFYATILLIFTISCSANKLSDKRYPILNTSYLEQEEQQNAEAQNEVLERINDFRYKEDFTRGVVDVDIEDLPDKLEVATMPVAGENLYKLPASKEKKVIKKNKKKKTYKKKSPKKKVTKKKVAKSPSKTMVKKVSASKKANSYVDLSKMPAQTKTMDDKKKDVAQKEQQISEMQNNAKNIKMPTSQSQAQNDDSASTASQGVSSKEQVNDKLDSLQARHQLTLDNAKKNTELSSNNSATNSVQTNTSTATVSPAAASTKAPAPAVPSVPAATVPTETNSKPMIPTIPVESDTSSVKTSTTSSSDDSANNGKSSSQDSANNPNIGIPPAPAIPSGFGSVASASSSGEGKVMFPTSPTESQTGKKKITIKKDMSLSVQ